MNGRLYDTAELDNYLDWEAAYLELMASTEFGRHYKEYMADALDLWPGHTVVDLGCGVGVDLAPLAAVVTDTGTVIGIDHEQDLVDRAAARLASSSVVQVRHGDVHDLPLDDPSVDRARTDRVLQHVENPLRALEEARRVLRPGGKVVLGEPDWYTLAVDHPNLPLAATYTRHLTDDVIRNPAIGRQLARLAVEAGFSSPEVVVLPAVFRDFDIAERILSLRRFTQSAVDASHMTEQTGRSWIDDLATGPFLAAVSFYVVTAEVPATR